MNKELDANTQLFVENPKQVEKILNLIEPEVATTYRDVVRLVPITNDDDLISEYNIIDKSGRASLVARDAELPKMTINGDRKTYKINKVGTSYFLKKQDIRLSKKNGGIELDTNSARIGRRFVEEENNRLIYLGDETFNYLGLVRETGVTTKTVSANLSATNVYDIIKEAIDAIPTKFNKLKYSFVLASTEYNKLTTRNANTDRTWITILRETYPNVNFVREDEIAAGKKYWDATLKTIVAGTGVLVPMSQETVWVKAGVVRNIPRDADLKENEEHAPSVKYNVRNFISMVEAAFPTAIILVKGM